jgi:hypothetical protein
MKLYSFLFFYFLYVTAVCGQVSVGYFPFQSVVSVSSNTEKLCWVDYKLETNSFASNLNMEISPKVNFRRGTLANYYVGIGVSLNPAYARTQLGITNGYFLDFGTRIKPLSAYKNFQIVFEISPYINQKFNDGNIRTKLGIAWNFIKKK